MTPDPLVCRSATPRLGILFNLREVRVLPQRRERRRCGPLVPCRAALACRARRGVGARRSRALRALRHAVPLPGSRPRPTRRSDSASRPWRQLEARGEPATIDVEYLVDRLRDLSRTLAEDAASQQDALTRRVRFSAQLELDIVAELRMLANDVDPGESEALPDTIAGFREGADLALRACVNTSSASPSWH